MKEGKQHFSTISTWVVTLSPSIRLQTACEIRLSMAGKLVSRAELSLDPQDRPLGEPLQAHSLTTIL